MTLLEAKASMGGRNVASWLDKLQLPATARQLINQQIRTRYDEPSRLSLLRPAEPCLPQRQ